MFREREPMLRVTILSAAPSIHFFSQADKPPPCDLIALPHTPQSDGAHSALAYIEGGNGKHRLM